MRTLVFTTIVHVALALIIGALGYGIGERAGRKDTLKAVEQVLVCANTCGGSWSVRDVGVDGTCTCVGWVLDAGRVYRADGGVMR